MSMDKILSSNNLALKIWGTQSSYWSELDFWKFKFEKSSSTNLIFQKSSSDQQGDCVPLIFRARLLLDKILSILIYVQHSSAHPTSSLDMYGSKWDFANKLFPLKNFLLFSPLTSSSSDLSSMWNNYRNFPNFPLQ